MMKKNYWVSFVVAMVVFAFGAVNSVTAQTTTMGVKFSTVAVSAGQTGVVVDVIITNHPAITTAGFDIQYPDAMTYVAAAASAPSGTWDMSPVEHTAATRTVNFTLLGNGVAAAAETKLASISFDMGTPLTQDSYGLTFVNTGENFVSAGAYVTVTADNTLTITVKKDPKVTATATPATGGSITPAGEKTYTAGESPKYAVTVAEGYRVKADSFKVSSDATAKLASDNTYTFTALKDGEIITVNVEFELIPTYKVTATAGEHGTITPAGEKTYKEGETPVYTVTVEKNYKVAKIEVLGDATAKLTDTFTYTFAPIKSESSISVTFELMKYKVTAAAGMGGTISDPGVKEYGALSKPAYTVTPLKGYMLDTFKVNGVDAMAALTTNADGSSIYTFPEIEKDSTIDVTFKIAAHTLTVKIVKPAGGTVKPVTGTMTDDGKVVVEDGKPQEFAITVKEGYQIVSAKIAWAGTPDAEVKLAIKDKKFTVPAVKEDGIVTVTFKAQIPIKISATPAKGGTVCADVECVPYQDVDAMGKPITKTDREIKVNSGADKTITATATKGYLIDEVKIDGVVVDVADELKFVHTFVKVVAPHTMDIVFVRDPEIHSADTGYIKDGKLVGNMDNVIDMPELLRVIQLFNTNLGKYICDPATEDGYASGDDAAKRTCWQHSADSDDNWELSLSELLRVIQFWSLGGYHIATPADAGFPTKDGFAPGK